MSFVDILDRLFKPRQDTPKAALHYRRKAILARLAALAKRLTGAPATEAERALDDERRMLLGQRYEIDSILRPTKAAAAERRRQRDAAASDRDRQIDMLQALIRERVDQIEAFATKLERQGEHWQARLHRGQLPFVGEELCRSYGLSVELLAHIEPPEPKPAESAAPWIVPRAMVASK